jgi:hypothetical protein
MNTATTARIPSLYCPIQSAVHADAHEINAAGLDWISEFKIFSSQLQWKRYVRAEPGMLPACVMPRAPKGPALQAAANLLFWLWAFDDLECDEAGAGQSADDLVLLLCSLARVGEAPVGRFSANPFIASLADLRRQLERVASAVQVARWASAMQAYLLANTAVAILNTRGTVHSGAVKPTLMLLDVADGYEVPAAQLERPEIWALNEMVCTIVGWDNDLLTYHKEVLRGGADHNLVTVLQRERGCSAAEAVSEAVAIRDRVLCLFLRLPDLKRYLAGLCSWVRGHLDWGMATARYRNPEAPADLPNDFADAPQDDSYEPLLIPSISWWWRQLACAPQAVAGAA